jgi:hypothetical protein
MRSDVEAAAEGVRLSPEDSSAEVMNVLKTGVGWARLGRKAEAQRAVERAEQIAARIPLPEHPDHHFTFDPRKLDLYVARIYAFLGMTEQAEIHARSVIEQSEPRTDQAFLAPPTRESFGRLDLATALLQRGEIEEACDEAGRAFGRILRYDVHKRAGEVDRWLGRYRQNRHVRDYHERYVMARQVLMDASARSSGPAGLPATPDLTQ